MVWVLVAVAWLVAVAGCHERPGGRQTPESRGARIYTLRCMRCHGPRGNGRGASGGLLAIKPRSFLTDDFRTAARPGAVPSDAQLHQVIQKGIPGTAMPSFPYLDRENRSDLIAFLKTFFARRRLLRPSPSTP